MKTKPFIEEFADEIVEAAIHYRDMVMHGTSNHSKEARADLFDAIAEYEKEVSE